MKTEPKPLPHADKRRAVEAVLRRLEEGGELRPSDLKPILGPSARSLSREDVLCIGGHLRSFRPSAEAALRILENAPMLDAVAQLRKALANRLFNLVAENAEFSVEVKHAYGLLSPYHERILRKAVRVGRFSYEDALRCGFNNEELAERLGQEKIALTLDFQTSLGLPNQPVPRPGEVQSDVPFTIRTPRGSFDLLVSGPLELWRAATLHTKEPETLKWLEETIEPGSVFYDVGANIGIYTLYALRLQPGVSAVCFEPDALNYARLNRNLKVNGLASALAFPIGLSDTTGLTRFGSRFFVNGASSPLGPFGIDAHEREGLDHQSGCVLYTLDDFLRAADFAPRPTHLKIDVDGPERKVLCGARRALRRARLRHLLVELFEDEVEEVSSFLAGFGFGQVAYRHHTQASSERGRIGNYIFQKAAPKRNRR
jgi:FkbM family methyltransferase